MLQLTAARLIAVGLVVGLAKMAPVPGVFAASVLSIAFGHYLLGLAYSRPQVMKAMSTWRGGTVLITLFGCGALLYAANVNIVWMFALHHAINEAFMLDRFTASARDNTVRWLRGAGFLFHLALYLAFVRRVVPIHHSTDWMLALLAISTVFYAGTLLGARRLLTVRELAGHTVVELVGLAVLALSFQTNVSVIHIAGYHFAVWAVFPAMQMAQARRYRGLAIYVAATAAVTGAFLAISPLRFTPWALAAAPFAMLFAFLSHIHITISFMLSRTNPWFITRLAEALQRPLALHTKVAANRAPEP
jgi:hypothetical protein